MKIKQILSNINTKSAANRSSKILVMAFKVLFLSVVGFTIVYPFITKATSMFMSEKDLMDSTVKLIPKNPTLYNLTFIMGYIDYFSTLFNTTMVALVSSLCSVICACMVGWGLARYKFKGNKILFGIVIFITILPPQTIMLGLFSTFRDFDIFGIFSLILGQPIRLIDTLWPTALLSITGLIFRGGLFIFIMRQFYTSIPKELVEAAKIDGCGQFTTFVRVIIPLSTAMLITVFLFSFAWMWSDTTYSSLFYSSLKLFSNQVSIVGWIDSEGIMYNTRMASVMINTAVLISMVPLIVIYVFLQRYFVEGIAKSGIVG